MELTQLSPSYGDLEAVMISMHEQNIVDVNKWLGMLLRTTAIKKQIENHCEIYGVLNLNIPQCQEFSHTIEGVNKSNPSCRQTKEIPIEINKLERLAPEIKGWSLI